MSASCRFCGKKLSDTFIDLGVSPLSNSYIDYDKLDYGEVFLPLKANICRECLLVQLDEYESPEGIFSEYAYLSSYSDSWLRHAKDYVDKVSKEFGIDKNSQVVELASNDGYLLQYFKQMGVPALGIEPAANVAEVARNKGIDTIVEFFGKELALKLKIQGIQADLIVANNVLAHVPDLNSFVGGMDILLKENGIITVEFPYLLNLIDYNQFDTIYHEHFSYFSFYTVNKVFSAHNMKLFRVELLETHGGSLRIYACHKSSSQEVEKSVFELDKYEQERHADTLAFYMSFKDHVEKIKADTLSFLIEAKRQGKRVCAYGAPAKGNTLLNYCGIGTEFIKFTVDRNPLKQNTYLPGSRIPVFHPDKIREFRPDYVVILPWNIKDEIIQQESDIRDWGGKFVIFIPETEIL